MARITASELEKALAKGSIVNNPLPVYFLYGPDMARIHSAATAIKNAFEERVGGPDNIFRILSLGDGPEETNVREAIAGLNTVSMFGSGKLMWIGPLAGLPKDVIGPLATYANDPNTQSILLLTVCLEKNEQIKVLEQSELFTAAAKNGVAARFEKMRDRELAVWASGKLAELGVKVDNNAVALMVEFCGKDMARLGVEVEKAAAYVGYKGKLTTLDVEESMVDIRMEKVWGFTDAFMAGNPSKCQMVLNDLLAHGAEPQLILKTLSLEVMKYAAAADFRRNGGSQDQFKAIMGENPFALRSAWEHGMKWDLPKAHTVLKAILKAQMDMMTSGVPAETALEAMLLSGMPKAALRA
ncbi:MAG: DNA polymerase III subunit delta [Nitrospinota bacterium]|nr:DNA polymerase III subunit delta [Nitrospinota bacterium]